MDMDKLRYELGFLSGYEVVVHGSCVSGDNHERSDIDIAVITRISDPRENMATFKQILGQSPPTYDISIYELLPLTVKIRVADAHLVLFGDEIELSEYFYHFRKLWKDCKHRVEQNIFSNMREKRKTLRMNARLQRTS